MNYRLYRLYRARTANSELGESDALGWFQDFDSALAARDRDVLAQLAERGGERLEVTHVIVGPGSSGPRTRHPVSSGVGGDRASFPSLDAQLADVDRWFAVIHGRGC